MKKITLTELLNLKCAKTGEVIQECEVVRLYDWGMSRRLMGYGHYEWDKYSRSFELKSCNALNNHFGFDRVSIDDDYDLFRTSPEKLSKKEQKILADNF